MPLRSCNVYVIYVIVLKYVCLTVTYTVDNHCLELSGESMFSLRTKICISTFDMSKFGRILKFGLIEVNF